MGDSRPEHVSLAEQSGIIAKGGAHIVSVAAQCAGHEVVKRAHGASLGIAARRRERARGAGRARPEAGPRGIPEGRENAVRAIGPAADGPPTLNAPAAPGKNPVAWLVRGLVLGQDVGRNAAAVGNLEALAPGPGPHI